MRDFADRHPDLVTVNESKRYPGLFVVKYHRRVFYKSLWTPELTEMRGLVIDKYWNVIVRPFDKIFNVHEADAPTFYDAEFVIAVRKINGFMAALTIDEKYGTIVSTTGSLDSPFVELASKHLLPIVERGLVHGVTYLFEIVDPQDPHIIEEKTGAYLIGARTLCSKLNLFECDLDAMAVGMGVMRPEWKESCFGAVMEEVQDCTHEGFVMYNARGEAVKIKSPYYLIKKFFTRVRAEKLTAEWFENNRKNFDEEFYPLVDFICENRESFTELTQQERGQFVGKFLRGDLEVRLLNEFRSI